MYKVKKKIYRKYDDFFTSEDLKDPNTPQRINLTIEDFDAKGQVANPRAPCVVATIDPEYTRDAALQRRTRKFRMKTDILRLREITRNKFMIFATQQRYLEKKRDAEHQENIYKQITEFQKFAADGLCKMESNAFCEMKQTQKQLEDLQEIKINDELKDITAEHQRVLMEVQEIYGRFLFLLKLIGYFDEIIAPEDIVQDTRERGACKLPQPTEIVKLQINERNPIGEKEVSSIIEYMDKIVRPYLAKRNHLNADIWIKFAADGLCKMESNAFCEMKQTQKQLEDLQEIKINDELKDITAEHQRVLMEVQEIYGRFLFLLKLIGYFDEIIAPEDIVQDTRERGACKLPQPTEIVKLQINERNPIGEKEVSSIIEYMDKIVRPYLAKRNHLNADIWIKEKTFARRTENSIFLKDPEFLKQRIELLKLRSVQVFDDFERKQKRDKLRLKLNAIVPVILQQIEVKFSKNNGNEIKISTVDKPRKNKNDPMKIGKNSKSSSPTSNEFCDSGDGTLEKVEKLQWHLMNLLQELEKIPPDEVQKLERQVRKRIEMQKDISRRALIKQNRLHNWMEHFRKHDRLHHQN